MQNNVQVIVGAQGIRSVYEQALEAKAADFICTSSGYEAVLGSWLDDEYLPRLYAEANTREVVQDTVENKEAVADKSERNQVRFVPETYQAETDIVLYGNSVALVSFDSETPMAVVISEPEMVQAMRNQFELVWQTAQE